VIGPGLLWAASPPQTPPSGPGAYYYSGPKDVKAGNDYDEGPVQGPPTPQVGGNQSVFEPKSFSGMSAFGSDGRLGGAGQPAVGAASASKSETVEKKLRRLANRLN
jgi:hypothetical protein